MFWVMSTRPRYGKWIFRIAWDRCVSTLIPPDALESTTLGSCLFAANRVPMEASYKESPFYRWLDKTVLDCRLLDDMHSLDTWTAITNGAIGLVDARSPYQVPQANQPSTERTCATVTCSIFRLPKSLRVQPTSQSS
jgi:hypothetical protein